MLQGDLASISGGTTERVLPCQFQVGSLQVEATHGKIVNEISKIISHKVHFKGAKGIENVATRVATITETHGLSGEGQQVVEYRCDGLAK